MARFSIFGRRTEPEPEQEASVVAFSGDLSHPVSHRSPFALMAGLSDIVKETNTLRDDSNFDNDFYLFDEMLKLDPELNGAVRAVSLTANNYTINYRSARNAQIRNAIQQLLERIDFDDSAYQCNAQPYGVWKRRKQICGFVS